MYTVVEVCALPITRVMCCSFHKYGHFFPGTGALEDIGMDEGLGYSVNVPLHEGIDDKMYSYLFRRVKLVSLQLWLPPFRKLNFVQ